MHRIETAFFLITVLHITQSVCEQCEVVKFIKENNAEKKCCVTDESDREKFKDSEKNFSIMKLKDVTYICFETDTTTEKKEKSIKIEKVDEEKTEKKLKKKPPLIVTYQFSDSEKRCPDDQVLDFDGKCIDAF
ncbi:hypothetical protein HHI36_016323 [Cryptolaemus montrouzieri]|uniref:Uncharacterized protein n=1 Tax=Cryptolaemus montrouzieri TaxID=559131 RepID=A0ABD2NJT2_9CUCU